MPTRPTLPLCALAATVLSAALLVACGGGDDPVTPEPTPTTLSLQKVGGFNRNTDGSNTLGAAEITAYDVSTQRLFIVNGANGSVDVVDLRNPAAPVLVGTINVSTVGAGLAGVNSVAVHNGLVALAIEANPKTSLGRVGFFNASTLALVNSVEVGAQPDMLTFTPDGLKLIVANEGEPNSYGLADSIDPEGSVSIVTVNRGGTPTVQTADFRAFIGQEATLRSQGVRIYGPNANAAQDIEPEYITISDDGLTAYVTLQENNAIAVVNIATATVTAIQPLGTKDHHLAGFGLDASDEDSGTNTNSGGPAIRIAPQPVRGLYLPDAIANYRVGGTTYLVTANEGDARADWPGFNEETRVRAHCTNGLDPAVFADAANLILDSNLGRLRITTTPNGGSDGKNAAGQCTALYAFGGRSFSIWTTTGTRVFDSGDQIEQRTLALPNVNFNASHDNNTLDGRSASKGPEPEGVVLGRMGNKTFAFIGLERVGGVMVYDVSTPASPSFVTYLNTRTGVTGDRGPEGLAFISAAQSPNGKALLVVGHEVSGTTAIYEVVPSY